MVTADNNTNVTVNNNAKASSAVPVTPASVQAAPNPPAPNTNIQSPSYYSGSLAFSLKSMTRDYLRRNPPHSQARSDTTGGLLDMYAQELQPINAVRPKGAKMKIPTELPIYITAMVIAANEQVKSIAGAGLSGSADYDMIGIYQEDGPDEGTYITDSSTFNRLVWAYNPDMPLRKVQEVEEHLKTILPRVEECSDPDLIPVNNGIFNYKTKKLLPFSPDYVFLSKSGVNYNENADNVTFHNDKDDTDWDVESWMNGLSHDPAIVNLLWQAVGAALRNGVDWGASMWFYNEGGCGGKGTLAQLIRNVLSEKACASIAMSEFGKDFMLEPVIGKKCIINDENDVGTYIDKAGAFKSIVTGDPILINRKHKSAITYRVHMFVIQCVNEMPRVKDRSGSFFRRLIFVPFDCCFTDNDRKYIKDDYIKRPEVLEYVLKKVLNMDYYSFDVPQSCVDAKEIYATYNDPVRQFATDALSECSWNRVPWDFLYDYFRSWYVKNFSKDAAVSKATFKKDLATALDKSSEWKVVCSDTGKEKQFKPSDKYNMMAPEPLIEEYDLADWRNKNYHGADMERRCTVIWEQKPMRGIERKESFILAKKARAASSDVVSDDVIEAPEPVVRSCEETMAAERGRSLDTVVKEDISIAAVTEAEAKDNDTKPSGDKTVVYTDELPFDAFDDDLAAANTRSSEGTSLLSESLIRAAIGINKSSMSTLRQRNIGHTSYKGHGHISHLFDWNHTVSMVCHITSGCVVEYRNDAARDVSVYNVRSSSLC